MARVVCKKLLKYLKAFLCILDLFFIMLLRAPMKKIKIAQNYVRNENN
jgi:hypothetical protein